MLGVAIYTMCRHARSCVQRQQIKQKTAYEIRLSLVGSEMCIRDRSFDILALYKSDYYYYYYYYYY